jgi:glycolate oxidase
MKSTRSTLLRRLQGRLAPGELSTEQQVRQAHAGDKWFASHMPDAVAFPQSTESVACVVAFASRHGIPVTARGAGHGYVGGCVPMHGGIVLSLARMNRIKEIHAGDFVTVVEPGVMTQQLQDAVEAKGLFYPPDPASRSDCSIGGNIATNAGGPRCLKYGVTRDYVLGLEVVLGDATVVQLGGRTHKNKSGFELARLFVGSEGLLGVVTEATLKLLPLPSFRACMSVGFSSTEAAAQALRAMLEAGFLPCALEVADAFTLGAAQKRTGSRLLVGCEAHLLVELDGHEGSVRADLARAQKAIPKPGIRFVRKAFGAAQCERLWKLRREFSYALRDTGLTKLNEDIAIPRSRLEDLFRFAAQLSLDQSLPIACFGHAGDGNIHVNIMVDDSAPDAKERSEAALDALFRQVIGWGGAITGEHGIGLAKKKWWPLAASPAVRGLHRRIKRVLDPRGILNPGKFV